MLAFDTRESEQAGDVKRNFFEEGHLSPSSFHERRLRMSCAGTVNEPGPARHAWDVPFIAEALGDFVSGPVRLTIEQPATRPGRTPASFAPWTRPVGRAARNLSHRALPGSPGGRLV